MSTIKILCIHGIGGKDASMNSQDGWGSKWKDAFAEMNFTHPDNITLMKFDTFFKGYNADLSDYWDFFKKTFCDKVEDRKYQKGLIKKWFDNYPDMVVEFLLDKDEIRKKLREELKKHIEKENPNVIFAHSLGSIMCYDFFTQPENSTQYEEIVLVTAGSQLGNPKLKNHDLKFPTEYLPIKFWYNLNNKKDRVFAKHSIQLQEDEDRFKEVKIVFEEDFGHDGLRYITNENAKKDIWEIIKNKQPKI